MLTQEKVLPNAQVGEREQLRRELLRLILKNEARRKGQAKVR